MKKMRIIMAACLVAMSVLAISCGCKSQEGEDVCTDSLTTDTVAVDTSAVDSVAVLTDTTCCHKN